MDEAVITREQQKQQLRFIWTAMLGAVGAYGAACVLAGRGGDAYADSDTVPLRHVFTLVGIALGGLSVWWRRHFLPDDADGTAARIKFTQLQGHSVVVWALSEAVGVCGLTLAFIVHSAREFIPFGAAAGALLVLHHPFRLPYARLTPN